MSLSLPPIAPGHDRGSVPAAASPPGWDAGHVSFGDVLEAINPLQYLPGVGTIYRAVTGDTVHPALRIAVAGAATFLLGGPIGLAAAMLGAVASEVLGVDSAAPAAAGTPAPAQVAAAHAAYHRVVRDT